jgi:dihydrofolate reductase
VAKLVYAAITSLDGYIEDENGNFDWGFPDAEVFAFINDFERGIGTYLYGRRLYETMLSWETLDDPHQPLMQDFAGIWRAADKIVFSRSSRLISSARTRIEREFDPGAIRRLKSETSRDITIGGAALAAHALRVGLVDELHLYLLPILVGAGKPALPENLRLELELLNEHRFAGGVVHLHYAVAPPQA